MSFIIQSHSLGVMITCGLVACYSLTHFLHNSLTHSRIYFHLSSLANYFLSSSKITLTFHTQVRVKQDWTKLYCEVLILCFLQLNGVKISVLCISVLSYEYLLLTILWRCYNAKQHVNRHGFNMTKSVLVQPHTYTNSFV